MPLQGAMAVEVGERFQTETHDALIMWSAPRQVNDRIRIGFKAGQRDQRPVARRVFFIHHSKATIENSFELRIRRGLYSPSLAGVAKLADAADSKSATGDSVGVQVPSPVPY